LPVGGTKVAASTAAIISKKQQTLRLPMDDFLEFRCIQLPYV
jgi:hypothetical protein